jgi:hypothetical protein
MRLPPVLAPAIAHPAIDRLDGAEHAGVNGLHCCSRIGEVASGYNWLLSERLKLGELFYAQRQPLFIG